MPLVSFCAAVRESFLDRLRAGAFSLTCVEDAPAVLHAKAVVSNGDVAFCLFADRGYVELSRLILDGEQLLEYPLNHWLVTRGMPTVPHASDRHIRETMQTFLANYADALNEIAPELLRADNHWRAAYPWPPLRLSGSNAAQLRAAMTSA